MQKESRKCKHQNHRQLLWGSNPTLQYSPNLRCPHKDFLLGRTSHDNHDSHACLLWAFGHQGLYIPNSKYKGATTWRLWLRVWRWQPTNKVFHGLSLFFHVICDSCHHRMLVQFVIITSRPDDSILSGLLWCLLHLVEFLLNGFYWWIVSFEWFFDARLQRVQRVQSWWRTAKEHRCKLSEVKGGLHDPNSSIHSEQIDNQAKLSK